MLLTAHASTPHYRRCRSSQTLSCRSPLTFLHLHLLPPLTHAPRCLQLPRRLAHEQTRDQVPRLVTYVLQNNKFCIALASCLKSDNTFISRF
jgi:hypothetical protein